MNQRDELLRLQKANAMMMKNAQSNSGNAKDMNELKMLREAQKNAAIVLADAEKNKKELEEMKLKNQELEALIQQLRERLASGGWTRARGEARIVKLEKNIIEINTELQMMIQKCGKHGILFDQKKQDYDNSQQMAHAYFTSWLVESLRAKKLEELLAAEKKKWEDKMKRYVICSFLIVFFCTLDTLWTVSCDFQ